MKMMLQQEAAVAVIEILGQEVRHKHGQQRLQRNGYYDIDDRVPQSLAQLRVGKELLIVLKSQKFRRLRQVVLCETVI